MPSQDLLNHPTTPGAPSACNLAETRTVQASPLRLGSNGRALWQVVSRFIQSSTAAILQSDLRKEDLGGDSRQEMQDANARVRTAGVLG